MVGHFDHVRSAGYLFVREFSLTAFKASATNEMNIPVNDTYIETQAHFVSF